MTSKSIKSEIMKSLDRVPESILRGQMENQLLEKGKLTKHLKDILIEDKQLLEKLTKGNKD